MGPVKSPKIRLGLIAFLLAALRVLDVAAASASSQAPSELSSLGQSYMNNLKNSVYAASRCMLTPVFGSDQLTVAVSADRIFAARDTVIAVDGELVAENSKSAFRDLLIKHGPNEEISIKLRRSGTELTVKARCMDAKTFYDLVLEASYAASKNDAATCTDKMGQASRVHLLASPGASLAFECAQQSGRLVKPADIARAYYDLRRLLILESAWSSDALSQIRGTILASVDTLQKYNAAFLGEDLKQQYDQAVAASLAITAPSNDRH